jgi:hypothetical protein
LGTEQILFGNNKNIFCLNEFQARVFDLTEVRGLQLLPLTGIAILKEEI